ncbi:alpha/beta-hydrolase [Ophiobolus disseminans]|uniref:Alpha/beta-hydrolase n=1 Tax=Ophiobolus disseminans TaxID=1469910 RepID=A0A6A6ZYX5_9PLEO|nr:alpha/beta-hydrolase [Ophiobolus disseminans]
MSKPHIVVVPGAWHDPSSMASVTSKLESVGYTIYARKMPGVGASTPPKDLSEDVAALRAMVDKALATGSDVVVICHSWGGMVTGSALIGYSKHEREKHGKKGGVVKVGYLAAFMVPVGVSLKDAIGGTWPAWFDVQEPYVYPTDPAIFYNDISEAEQKRWFATLHSQTVATMVAPATGASWEEIPSAYLLCEDDRAIPAAGQEAMIQGAKDAGAQVDVTRIKASHSPFLSKVDDTVKWIRGVAGEGV